MVLSEFFHNYINSHIKNGKKYLLIEKRLSWESLEKMKMLPRLSKEEVSESYTYLGSKLKEGDIVFFARLEKPAIIEGMKVYESSMITLSEDEFEKFYFLGDCTMPGQIQIPIIKMKEENF